MKKAMAWRFAALFARKIRPARQLPTYDGTKSYQNLLVGVYEMTTSNRINYDTEVQRIPLDFIRGGYYWHVNGRISDKTDLGRYWGVVSNSSTSAQSFGFGSVLLDPQHTNGKGVGLFLRCLVRWSFPSTPYLRWY